MAELATGAVSSLLGVIRNEAQLLGGVRGDVQFIKEEMESMNSFLLHLARTVPPGGDHEEQVRTWMNQVRLLAQDCNKCIDLYLYRGNADIHLARGGLRRYLWWAPWFLRKMAAQHRAAVQLQALKERARHVGERRLRYGVEVPAPNAKAVGILAPGGGGATVAPPVSTVAAPAATGAGGGESDEDEEEVVVDGDDQRLVVPVETEYSASSRPRAAALFEPRSLDDYFQEKLVQWAIQVQQLEAKKDEEDEEFAAPEGEEELLSSMAIVARDADQGVALALARQTLVVPGTYFDRSVLVDIPALHHNFFPLRPKEILYYILRELQHDARSQHEEQQGTSSRVRGRESPLEDWQVYDRKWDIYYEKREKFREIKRDIPKEGIRRRLDKLKKVAQDEQKIKGQRLQLQTDLEQMKSVEQLAQKPLDMLFRLLLLAQQDQLRNRAMFKLVKWYDDIIKITAIKLDEHMEDYEDEEEENDEETTLIELDGPQYERLLQDVFPKPSNGMPQKAQDEQGTTQATKSTTMVVEDQLKEMIHKVTEMVEKLQEEPGGGHVQNKEVAFTEIERKVKEIEEGIREQLKIKWLVDRIIEDYLEGNVTTLIVLKIGEAIHGSTWEEIRSALSLFGSEVPGVLIVTTPKNTQEAKQYCYPPREPVQYSLAGIYHDIVLELTSQYKHEDNYSPETFRSILDECQAYEFCMKIFAHSLYAKPKRSNEELRKLLSTLQAVSPKSKVNIAKKMFKFSYRDMPQEYKTCLLYLAIFPPGHKIRRSDLIGRWIAEGLITTEDWRWSSSVPQAERCFDAFIDRWLIYPVDIGATGKVKSCIVGDIIHKFIAKIAKKQRIMEARLSHHLARHFSIFNDLHLRGSDTIYSFLQNLSKSYQLSQLKVLDLEGCQYLEKNQRYLKDICTKILLLKYLSLRGTDVTKLPTEINNLHELEVLDIRQTKVPATATRNLMLLKLKRLLAGHINPSSSCTETGMATRFDEFSSAWVPEKIEKMLNMEVLSNVKGPTSQDLKDIGRLWQLRKLGVTVTDKDSHLKNLLRAISDLHECLRSLSITLTTSGSSVDPSRELPAHIRSQLSYPPDLLETLSITGTTKLGKLLPLLTKYGNQLVKVTLHSTWINQKDLKVLSNLPKLQCIRLRHKAYSESKLTFNKDEFQNLKYFIVEGSNMTNINFEDGASRELEKIVLLFTNIESIDGIGDLPKLEELELNNNNDRLLPLLDSAKQISRVTLRGTLLNQDDLHILANKPNIQCLVLLDSAYVENCLTFNKDEFPKLKFLIVHCSNITKIIFTKGSAVKVEKIIWSFNSKDPFLGIDNLPRLKELEFTGEILPKEVESTFKIRYDFKLNKPKNQDYKLKKPENQDQATGNAPEEADVASCPSFFWKKNKA